MAVNNWPSGVIDDFAGNFVRHSMDAKVSKSKTNAQVLSEGLKDFDRQENFIQEEIADYIACPSMADCKFDGIDTSCCAPCKVKWLMSNWEG